MDAADFGNQYRSILLTCKYSRVVYDSHLRRTFAPSCSGMMRYLPCKWALPVCPWKRVHVMFLFTYLHAKTKESLFLHHVTRDCFTCSARLVPPDTIPLPVKVSEFPSDAQVLSSALHIKPLQAFLISLVSPFLSVVSLLNRSLWDAFGISLLLLCFVFFVLKDYLSVRM